MRATELEERVTTVSAEEAAVCLGLEAGTLANWRWTGRGPHFIKVGGRVRYRLSDLAEYLDRQTRSSTSAGGSHA